jgi:spermidine synthase
MRRGPFLSLIFFVSGAAGLIFEIAWFYRCALIFGSSVWAAAITLASFMGGLAIGNALVGWRSDDLARPLRIYATAEFVVATAGIAVVHGLTLSTRLGLPLAQASIDSPRLINLIRLTTAFVVLLIPATAMGATLPLLVSARCGARGGVGTVLGRLYGWNTLGAVCGSVVAEAVLVRRFGVTGSAWIAGVLDGGAGLAALWLSRVPDADSEGLRTRELEETATREASAARAGSAKLARPRRILLAAFAAGGTLLALEVVWFRFMSMYVLTTTLAMSLMLAVVLAAIGIGSLAASTWLARGGGAIGHVPAVSLMAGCAVVLSYASFRTLTHGTQVGDWRQVLWFACVLTVPTSALSGVIFTLLGEALARDVTVGARAAAWLTLANTTGAMIGPLFATFLLLPVIGMELSFFVLSASYLVVALFSASTLDRGAPVWRRSTLAAAGAALLYALGAFPFGLMRDTYFPRAAAAYADDGSEIVETREGPSETIFLMQQSWMGKAVYQRLVTNGFSMSGTAISAERYMRDFVYLPMLLHKGPLRHALVVCYGVGVTASAATDLPSIESIDIVELSRDIIAMSDFIYPTDRHPLHDPRVRLHLEDGRFFLATTRERFDLITGEPPPPRTPGAVNIYTRDYFQLIYERLAEGGMTTYWLPVARPNPGTDVDTIIRAFCDVFEDCSLWNATPFDLMLVGSRHAAGGVSAEEFSSPWSMPALGAKLRAVGFEQPRQVGATFLGDASFLRALTANTPAVTDEYPQRLRPDPTRASLSDPRYGLEPEAAELYQRVMDSDRARRAFETSPLVRRYFPASLVGETLPMFDEQRILNRVMWEGGRPLRLIEDLDAVLTHTSLRTLPIWILGSDDVKQRIGAAANDREGTREYVNGIDALAMRQFADAAGLFAEAERRGFGGATVRSLRAYALCRADLVEEAQGLASGAQPHDADETHFWDWMRRACGNQG